MAEVSAEGPLWKLGERRDCNDSSLTRKGETGSDKEYG